MKTREGQKSQVLVVDDDVLVCESLRDVLTDEGYDVFVCQSFESAKNVLSSRQVEVALLDVWLENEDGLECLPQVLSAPSQPEVIMISGHASIDSAVKATKRGAYDFLEKPISIERLLLTLRHALDARSLKVENKKMLQKQLSSRLLGRSKGVLDLHHKIRTIGKSATPVLITGENGTGKEVVARLIHEYSPRSLHPFVAVNCAAIPESLIESELFGFEKGAFTGAQFLRMGKVEAAQNGTLFLDEVGDLSLPAQAKLLRVIQEKAILRLGSTKEIPVHVRWLSATNRNLEQLVREGRFREDLYFRLNVLQVPLTPLRDRKEDIEPLASHFIREVCVENDILVKILTASALEKLVSYSWPGNVRELKNIIEKAVVLSEELELTEKDIELGASITADEKSMNPFESLSKIRDFREAKSEFERSFLQNELEKAGHNVSKLATQIGLERTYLYRKLKHYGLVGEGLPVEGGLQE